jgi:type IV pilus assembly protein PilY1
MKRLLTLLGIAALGATLGAETARATLGDIEVFSTYVPPNVMILLDSSDGMNHHLWDDDFNPQKLYPGNWCDEESEYWGTAPTIPGSSCPGLGNPGDECPDNEFVYGDDASGNTKDPHLLSGNSDKHTYTHCGVTRDQYHDSTTVPKTRYSLNYLNWLYGVASPTDLANEPTKTRLQVGKETLLQVLTAIAPPDESGKERMRVGLALFDSSSTAEGYNLKSSIADNNMTSTFSSIEGASANARAAPLSESLLDIGRYFAGPDGLANFPTSSLKSPIDAACRKNFAIVISSGQPSDDRHEYWWTEFLENIGDYDGDANECSAVAPSSCTAADLTASLCYDSVTGLDSCRDDGLIYQNGGSDWLDDVAAYLYDTDLNPNLDGVQNLITYTVGFMTDQPLLREAALAGDGRYFTSDPGNVQSFANALTAALLDIIERATAFTAAAVPSSRTSFGDGFYTAYFIPSNGRPNWAGHLEAYRLDASGAIRDINGDLVTDPNTGAFNDPRQPIWDAAKVLLDPNATRSIYTTQYGSRVDFNSTNIGPAELQITTAEAPAYPGYPDLGMTTDTALAAGIVDFVYGRDVFDEDFDGDTSELRESVLGDFFHSNPIVVGPPKRLFLREEGFAKPSPADPDATPFVEAYAQRDRVIYAGANDGMLHAFDAGHFGGDAPNTEPVETLHYTPGSGTELFGYIPSMLLSTADPNAGLGQLKYLPLNTPRNYYFVDGSPAVADAWLGDPNNPYDVTKQPSEWATVLIVGLRQGGRGYLALDVTDPTGTSSEHSPYPKFLWEFNGDSHPELGETWSEAIITRIKLKGPTGLGDKCGKNDGDGDCLERWVAIFGAGYDEDADPNLGSFSDDPNDPSWTDRGKAIFMVDVRTGDVLAKLAFDASGTTSAMKYAVANTPAVLDVNFDGFADVVYFGDLGGQLWKWTVSGVGEDTDSDLLIDWPHGVFFKTDPGDMGGGEFHYRSIFHPPSVTLKDGGTLVMAFGTGERTDLAYPGVSSKPDNNRFYVVKDTSWQTISSTLSENNLTDITSAANDTDLSDAGFYFEAEESEKFITNHTIFAGYAITTSYLPDLTGTDICQRSGTSRLYIFNIFGGNGYFADGVVPPAQARYMSLGQGAPNDPRVTISRTGDQMYIQTSTGRLIKPPTPPRPGKPVETIFWRLRY